MKKKTATIITVLLLILCLLAGCAPVPATPDPGPETDPPVTTQAKPPETTPPTTEPESTTHPTDMQDFLSVRPVPDAFSIYACWPEWDMSKLYAEEMKEYSAYVYPFWKSPAARSDWITLQIESLAVNLIGKGKESNITDELLGKLAWLEVEWEYLNSQPVEKSLFPYLELNREDYLDVLPATGVKIDSPYVMPEVYDVQIQDPGWFDRPHYWNDAVTAKVYPYWESTAYRITWIESLLGQYRILALASGVGAFAEGELEQIAWLEAQHTYLGAELSESIFTMLNLDPADYLTAK